MGFMYWAPPALMIAAAFLGLRVRQNTGHPPGPKFRSALNALMMATILDGGVGIAWSWDISGDSLFRTAAEQGLSYAGLILKVVSAAQLLFLILGTIFFVQFVTRECEESSAGAPDKAPRGQPDATPAASADAPENERAH